MTPEQRKEFMEDLDAIDALIIGERGAMEFHKGWIAHFEAERRTLLAMFPEIRDWPAPTEKTEAP